MPERLAPLSKFVDISTQRGMIALLWIIRQAGTISYPELYQEVFGQPAASQDDAFKTNAVNIQQVFMFHNVLMQMFQNNVIETTHPLPTNSIIDLFQPQVLSEDGIPIKMRVAAHMSFIQHIFDISLTEIVLRGQPIKSHPIFGDPIDSFEIEWSDVFVIMPFRDELRDVYDKAIKPAVIDSNLTVRRGDDFFSDQRIMDEVWSAIYHSKLCIVECTRLNPNVFYELGIAHTLGRQTIMIAHETVDIPFDIRDRRCVLYQNGEAGLQALRETLRKSIEAELTSNDGD